MKPFTTVTGTLAPLDRADVDTDQIIPKQFLKRIERTGFGEFLFFDWRGGEGFPLERPGPPRCADPGYGSQLRLRIVSRARPVGARGLRLSGDHRAVVRRHLQVQLHQDRTAPGGAARGRGPRS